MLSSIKSIELISHLLQGKREKMQSDIYTPQKPEMPEFRQDPQPLEGLRRKPRESLPTG